MNIGFVGLGKLGLPVALSIEHHGHSVYGYDVNPSVKRYLEERVIPYHEEGTPELLKDHDLQYCDDISAVVEHSDIVFVPIQTPHDRKYEGVTRIPEERTDFNYEYLKEGIATIASAAKDKKKHITLIIISTVLPGTIEREIKPILKENKYIHLCYNPFFIAMGTTRNDFENPEFVLLGCDDEDENIVDTVKELYATIHDKPVFETSIINAELIKVIYNTYISSKIAFINTTMEICEKVGADVDAVSDALALATDRIISTKYLRGGMGDGGGCHPRDNIALSSLARHLGLSFDLFDAIMKQRENQTEWFADIIENVQEQTGLPVVILGKSFKKGTNITTGSPSVLLANIIQCERAMQFVQADPYTSDAGQYQGLLDHIAKYPVIAFIGTNHDVFKDVRFAKGSVVLDPWGYIPKQDGVNVYHIGRKHD